MLNQNRKQEHRMRYQRSSVRGNHSTQNFKLKRGHNAKTIAF